MKTVTIHEAKTQLSRLIQEAVAGEEMIIANRNQPMVKLAVVHADSPRRRFGALKSMVEAMGDSFDDPPEDFAEYAPPPWHHRDPFDRILVAQARCENLRLLSADPALDAYDVARVW